MEVAEAIENPFGEISTFKTKKSSSDLNVIYVIGNDADDFHICQLVSRHLWAIGKNLDLYDGPPSIEDSNDEDEDDEDAEEDGDVADNVKININKSE